MVRREGKFGPFLACPASYAGDNHGTASLREEARDYERQLALSPHVYDDEAEHEKGRALLGGDDGEDRPQYDPWMGGWF
jgi:hypothetical protein